MRCMNRMQPNPSVYKFTPSSTRDPPTSHSICFGRLFERDAPDLIHPPSALSGSSPETTKLYHLLSEFRSNENASTLHRLYGTDLENSRKKLDLEGGHRHLGPEDLWNCYSPKVMRDYSEQCERHLELVFSTISRSLSPLNSVDEVVFTAGQWPRLTVKSLLSKLTFSSMAVLKLTVSWQKVLVSYTQAMLRFQRAQRLLRSFHVRNHEEFRKELENTVSDIHDGVQYSDWFLIQVRLHALI
jgi:hypothetical protein